MALPSRPQPAYLSGVEQLLSPQTHLHDRVNPGPVQCHLALLPHLLLQGLHLSRVGLRWLTGSPQVGKRPRQARMLTSINEERPGGQATTQCGGSVGPSYER